MDTRIQRLENSSETSELNIEQLIAEYRNLETARPVWQLVQDIQQQAMLYTNIIEQLKSGQSAAAIRMQFEGLDLVPPGVLPNPGEHKLLRKALDKLAYYREALVNIVQRFGGELLKDLDFESDVSVSLGVNVGFPPAITIAFQYTASVRPQTAEWSNKTEPARN